MQRAHPSIGFSSLVLIIIASMVGTGVFGITGILQSIVNQPAAILVLWPFCGLVALCGALCYGRLSINYRGNGGDYLYLKHLWGDLPAFLSGWVSIFVAFSAPVAISSLLVSSYLAEALKLLGISFFHDLVLQKMLSAIVVIVFGLLHSLNLKRGLYIQNILTVSKVAILLTFILCVFFVGGTDAPLKQLTENISLSNFSLQGLGVAFLLVMFSYSGWNAASYLGGEVRNPEATIPKALVIGGLIVTVLYLLVNLSVYSALPAERISGVKAVLAVPLMNKFGRTASILFNVSFIMVLLSSISVNVMIGPRVVYAMAKDGLFWKFLDHVGPRGEVPTKAIIFQTTVSILYIFIGAYESILTYMGVSLSIFPLLTVLGLIKSMQEDKSSFSKCSYFAPLFFAVSMGGMIVLTFWQRPLESIVAVLVIFCGALIYKSHFKKKSLLLQEEGGL